MTWASFLLNAIPVIVSLPLQLLAFGLGLAGLFHAHRRRTFAVLGLALSLAAPAFWLSS